VLRETRRITVLVKSDSPSVAESSSGLIRRELQHGETAYDGHKGSREEESPATVDPTEGLENRHTATVG